MEPLSAVLAALRSSLTQWPVFDQCRVNKCRRKNLETQFTSRTLSSSSCLLFWMRPKMSLTFFSAWTSVSLILRQSQYVWNHTSLLRVRFPLLRVRKTAAHSLTEGSSATAGSSTISPLGLFNCSSPSLSPTGRTRFPNNIPSISLSYPLATLEAAVEGDSGLESKRLVVVDDTERGLLISVTATPPRIFA